MLAKSGDMTKVFDEISKKAAVGEPLSDADAQALFLTHDIIALGVAADAARLRRHDNQVTYVRVADVTVGQAGGQDWPSAAGEVRLTNQSADLDTMLAHAQRIVSVADDIAVSAFSLVDLESAAKSAGEALGKVLARVRATGLEWIADVAIDRLADATTAFRALAENGLHPARVIVERVPAAGMLPVYRQIQALQAELGIVRAFAPLPRRLSSAHPTTGYEDVKHVAIARLLLHDVETIQVDWSLYGPKLAQVALAFGADDLDAVSASDEAPAGPRRAPLEEVRRNIKAASRVPVERDGHFRIKVGQ
jgi:2-iminoacetate synthase ThiH